MKGKRTLFVIGIIFFIVAVGGGGYMYMHRTKKAVSTLNQAEQAAESDVTPNTTPNASPTPNATPQPPAAFNKQRYPLDHAASQWVVVNKTRPLNPLKYAPGDLTAVGGGQTMRLNAATALKKLTGDAKNLGMTISPLSGYRSYETQVAVYANEVKTNGQAVADSQSAKPGYSEHQTGWAIDVGGGGCGIEDCFGTTAEGKWVAQHAYEYGFIIRYPADKQAVTGYRYEPWHLRFVGVDLSKEMQKQGVTTLEEFFGL